MVLVKFAYLLYFLRTDVVILVKGGAHLQNVVISLKETLNEIRTTSNQFRVFDYLGIPILNGIGQSCVELSFWPIGPKICLG